MNKSVQVYSKTKKKMNNKFKKKKKKESVLSVAVSSYFL